MEQKPKMSFKEMGMHFLSKMDKQKWLVCILMGVLFIVISLPVEKEEDTKEIQEEQQVSAESSTNDYERKLEKRLTALLEEIEGVGRVEVMITLQDSGESVVAQDVNQQTKSSNSESGESTQENSTERTTVFSGETPYETKTKTPEIRGICVVAEGAQNDEVRVRIYQAVQALFSVEAHKISIVEMGSQEGT